MRISELAERIAELGQLGAQLDLVRVALEDSTPPPPCRTDLSCCMPTTDVTAGAGGARSHTRALRSRALLVPSLVDLRPALHQDAEAVAEVWLRSRRASTPAIPPPVHTDDEVRAWFAEVVLPTLEVWLADADGSVVGLLVLDEGWIDQLYVDPEHVGRGIGSELVALAKQRRPAGLELWTFQANAGARRFYERHGFVVADMTSGDNEEGAPDVRYEWRPLDRQPVLQSELVQLRPLAPGDLDDLFAIAADPLLWEQHPAKERATPAGFRRWFEEAMASAGALVLIDRRDGRVIGTSRFDHYDAARSEVEIGWTFLARSLWGGAFNGEMKRLMLQHAFATVDTVLFRVHSGNVRSQRAVEKLGATRVDTEPDPYGTGHVVVFGLGAPRRA